jgi:phosphoribulokinase
MNLWEDTASREAILSYGKNRIVFAGLWTDVCLAFPVISALAAGFEVYFIADASGSVSKEAHDIAVQRMIQAGAVPLTTIAYISENIRDYGRKDNTDQNVGQLLHEGMIKYMNFGIGVDYADHMVQSYPYYKGFGKEA